MWVLESSGDLFEGKRIWLRPGRDYLFGRTSAGPGPTRGYAIAHKGVSRKHLTISIGKVEDGTTGLVNQKTKLTITDDSKFGTTLDGDKIQKDTCILDRDQHSIRLGSYDQVFTIKWQRVVLTSISSKAGTLNTQRAKIEPLGVKLITEFLYDKTTHVVSGKRNLPKVLQGIVGAKYIVTEAYLDALADASESPGVDDDGETPLPSRLEQDLDAHWPDPMQFVPPPSAEPVPREASYLKPDVERTGLFEGFTFVFNTAQQHDSLEPALSLGGAKCPLIEVEPLSTKAAHVTKQVRELAGKANKEGFNADSPKGVVVIRLQPPKNASPEVNDWAIKFGQDVQSQLNQRSVDQREFLDAILTKNTSGLKRALEYQDETTSLPPSSLQKSTPAQQDPQAASEPPRARRDLTSAQPFQQTNSHVQASDQQNSAPTSQTAQAASQEVEQQPEPSPEPMPQPPRLRARRVPTKRFKGFDDFDTEPPAPAPDPMEEDEPAPPSNQAAVATQDRGAAPAGNEAPQSQGLFVSQEAPATSTRSKKRASPPADSDGEPLDPDAAMDAYLPGSRALKKRRLERPETTRPAPQTPALDSDDEPPQPPSKDKPKAKGKKDVSNQQAELRQRAKDHANAIDKVKREDEPEEDADEVSKLRDLAIIEEMDVPRLREPTSRTANGATNPRSSKSATKGKGKATSHQPNKENDTDPYAGRKNFKRFRRKGEGTNRTDYNRGTRVIVGLELSQPKDYGIGDKYWASFSPTSSSKSKRKTQSQSQNLSQANRGGAGRGRERVEDTLIPDDRDGDGDGDGDEDEAIPHVDALTARAIEADEREQRRMDETLPEELAGPVSDSHSWVHDSVRRTQASLSEARSSGRSDPSAGRGKQASGSRGDRASDSRGDRAVDRASSRKRAAGKAPEPEPKRRQTVLGRGAGRFGRVEEVEEESSEDDELAFKLRRR